MNPKQDPDSQSDRTTKDSQRRFRPPEVSEVGMSISPSCETPKPLREARSIETSTDVPQRRKERGSADDGTVEFHHPTDDCDLTRTNRKAKLSSPHREEVAGQGSGETAGGSPVTAGGDLTPAKPTSSDPALEFDPAKLGGVSSNTPPSIPKADSNEVNQSQQSTGGEDWFEVSLYLRHHRFARLSKRLEVAKTAAEANRRPADEVNLGKLRAVCLPRPAYVGDRITYRWQLRTAGGWLIQLMNRAEPHPTLPNGIVRFTSVPLMRFGAEACWKKALEWMDAFDAEVVRACPGRVDPCVDLAGVSIEQLDEPYRAGHYVSRARLSKEHGIETPLQEHRFGRKSTGFSLGSSQKRVRAYDKHRETRGQPEKRALLVERRWGELVDSAVRVEFQLRRESLKHYGVDSVDDYFARRAAIVWDLCENWFRLTDGPVDSKHPERSRVLPLWWEVALAFTDWAGDSIEVELAPLPKGAADLSHLKQQLYGLTQSVLVRDERPILSLDDFVHEGMDLLLSIAETRDVVADCRRKAFLLGQHAEGQP